MVSISFLSCFLGEYEHSHDLPALLGRRGPRARLGHGDGFLEGGASKPVRVALHYIGGHCVHAMFLRIGPIRVHKHHVWLDVHGRFGLPLDLVET